MTAQLDPATAPVIGPDPAGVIVELVGANVRVMPHPTMQDGKLVLIGPITLALSLDSAAAEVIQKGLSRVGIVLAPAGSLPNGGI